MGHAEHFLSRLERLGYQETELALSLYRDTKLLRGVLHVAKIPEAHERVAIALRNEEGGPHLLVTRAGDFVTCLGDGMTPVNVALIPRRQLDEISVLVDSLRERIEIARRLVGPGKHTTTLTRRLGDSGHLLSREEFLGISAFSSMRGLQFIQRMLKSGCDLMVRSLRLLPLASASLHSAPVRTELLQLWNEMWEVAHLVALCTEFAPAVNDINVQHDGDMMDASACAFHLDFRPLGLRTLRFTANAGEGIVPRYEKALHETEGWRQLEAVSGLFAVGLRFQPARERVRESLARLPELIDAEDSVLGAPLPEVRDLLLKQLDDPDSTLELHASQGREDWVAWTSKLAPDSPLRFPDPDSEQARLFSALAGFNSPGGVVTEPRRIIVGAGAAALVDPESLYWPAQQLNEVRKVLDEDWAVAHAARYLGHLRPFLNKTEPDRVEHRAAPNDRCPCGSGKKFKRCCMGKAA